MARKPVPPGARPSGSTGRRKPTTGPTGLFLAVLRHLLPAAVAAVLYLPTRSYDFTFDDNPHILQNKDVHAATGLWSVFLHDNWGRDIGSDVSNTQYRPLTVLSMRADYVRAGGLHPGAFHLSNVAWYAASVLLFQAVLSYAVKASDGTAFTAAVLFAVHPIHTEAIANVTGRAEPLSSVGQFLALLAWEAMRRAEAKPRAAAFFAAAVAATAAGALCKEGCVMTVVVTLLADLLIPRSPGGGGNGGAEAGQGAPCGGRSLAPHAVTFAVLAAALGVRHRVLPRWTPFGIRHIDNPFMSLESARSRALSLMYLHARYLGLLVAPVELSADYSYNSIPAVESLQDPRNLITAAAYGALLAALALAATRRDKTALFAILWGGAQFAPASGVLFHVGTTIAERALYLPSAGFCLLAALALERLGRRRRKLRWAAALGLAAALGARTCIRIPAWRDSLALWEETYRANPSNAKAASTLAGNYRALGDTERAGELLAAALAIKPDYDAVLIEAGRTAASEGRFGEGAELFRRAAAANEYMVADALGELGTTLVEGAGSGSERRRAACEEAEPHLLEAVGLKPSLHVAWVHLGLCRQARGDLSGAYDALARGYEQSALDWDAAVVAEHMAWLHHERRELETALKWSRKAVELSGDEAGFARRHAQRISVFAKDRFEEPSKQAAVAEQGGGGPEERESARHLRLAMTLMGEGTAAVCGEAEAHLAEVTQLSPEDFRGWGNLGICKSWRGDLAGAAKDLRAAHGLAPEGPEAAHLADRLAEVLLDLDYGHADEALRYSRLAALSGTYAERHQARIARVSQFFEHAIAGNDPLLSDDVHFQLGTMVLKADPRAQTCQDIAEPHLRRAVDKDPGHYQAWTNLGICMMLREDFAHAVSALSRGVNLTPDGMARSIAADHLANVLMHTGQVEQALFYSKMATEMTPDNEDFAMRHGDRLKRAEGRGKS